MTIVFASSNPHKTQEMQQLLSPFGISVRAASEFISNLPEPVEDADSFEGNARIKATTYAASLGMLCLADDSGLEVTALGGAPGLHSARYAGVGDTRATRDQANREKLLSELGELGNVDRSARLICVLCLADAQGRVLFTTRGSASAKITEAAQGVNGFGYDSLLLLPELGKTIAELSEAEWNQRSHRAAAVRSLVGYLEANPQAS